ncbi:MAG: hypothetical protein HQK84_05220 [Nitrospinae bacterium]|nr:hypothetical protein [Nitrospinota bacterium]
MFSSLKDKLFGKKEEQHYDITNITIDDLDVGFIFDFRDATWEVIGKNGYETDEGEYFELVIKSATETLFLEAGNEDKESWTVSRKIPIGKLGGGYQRIH